MNYIYNVILIIFGLFFIINPRFMWRLEQIIMLKSGEPSKLYIGLMRIGGIGLIIASIVLFFT